MRGRCAAVPLTALFVLPVLALLAGPTAAAQGADREARINAAIPLSPQAQAALEQMRRLAPSREALAPLEQELRVKRQLRALKCTQNYTIPADASAEQIRREHGGDPCFAQFDASLADWLGLHSVGFLLAMPPLRSPVAISRTMADAEAANITQAHFAAGAGVAVMKSWKDTEVMDLALGVPIFTNVHPPDETLTSLSPNGRVYTAAHGSELRFYDVQTGALLAAPDWCVFVSSTCGFHWLDDRTALMSRGFQPGGAPAGPQLYDFSLATYTPFGSTAPLGYPGQVIHLARTFLPTPAYIVFADSGVTRFRLTYDNDGQVHMVVLDQQAMRMNLRWPDAGGIDTGGRYFFDASNDELYVTTTADLHTESVDLGDFLVERVIPGLRPGSALLFGYPKGQTHGEQWYEYSVLGETVAPIQTDALPARQFLRGAGPNPLFMIAGSTLVPVRDLPLGPAVSRQTFIARIGAASQSAAQPGLLAVPHAPFQRVAPLPPRPGVTLVLPPGSTFTSGGRVSGYVRVPPQPATPIPGPIATLARNADVLGIGVFGADTGAAGASTGGIITVQVQAGRADIILVLSSFTGVHWDLALEPGARLKEVLLSGPHTSTVSGEGAARVVAIGSAYSDTLGSPGYTQLQDEVYTWTGKRISLFQCGYRASSFSVFSLQ